MKFFVAFAALLAVASAKNIKIAAVRDCGDAGAVVTFNGAVKTDPVPVPGVMVTDLGFTSTLDSPDDMIFKKVTTRLSDNYQVPCLDGIAGTCTVPLCFAITNFPDAVCPLFPPELPCECPIRAGTYFSSNTQVAFDEQWLTLDGGVAGDYTSRIEFVSSGTVFGCVELDFTLTAA